MKILLTIIFILMAVAVNTAAVVVFQTDNDVLWRILKEWFFVALAIISIFGIAFAAYRGKSYTELERLANTREKTIADLTARTLCLEKEIDDLKRQREELRENNLRLQGEAARSHRNNER